MTEAGKTVYQYSLHINSLFEELDTVLNHTSFTGEIKIGSSITIGTRYMPDFIKEFSYLYPNVQAHVTIDSSEIIERLILSNELDFAFIEGTTHTENIISKDFKSDELIVICNTTHPLLQKEKISINELSKQNFLMREKNSGTRELAESILSLHHIFINPIWESTSTEAIIQGVSKGIGISILPLQLVQSYMNRGEIARLKIDGLEFHRQFQIIYHKNKFLSLAAQTFIEFCSNMPTTTH